MSKLLYFPHNMKNFIFCSTCFPKTETFNTKSILSINQKSIIPYISPVEVRKKAVSEQTHLVSDKTHLESDKTHLASEKSLANDKNCSTNNKSDVKEDTWNNRYNQTRITNVNRIRLNKLTILKLHLNDNMVNFFPKELLEQHEDAIKSIKIYQSDKQFRNLKKYPRKPHLMHYAIHNTMKNIIQFISNNDPFILQLLIDLFDNLQTFNIISDDFEHVESVMIISMIIFNRFIKPCDNVVRLISYLVCYLIASKLIEDDHYTNKSYAIVFAMAFNDFYSSSEVFLDNCDLINFLIKNMYFSDLHHNTIVIQIMEHYVLQTLDYNLYFSLDVFDETKLFFKTKV